VHHAGLVEARFSPFRVVDEYAARAREHGLSPPAAFDAARSLATQIEGSLPPLAERFCHNDLLNANFIDDGAAVRIVDWEYAGMGDRSFDFGNFAVNNELDEAGERTLLAEYFGSCTGREHARLRLMRIMSDFREAMWGLVQQGISSLEVDFAEYARRHFDRLLESTADPRYRQWLSACA
jgi:thiamine kinase-like enzyme